MDDALPDDEAQSISDAMAAEVDRINALAFRRMWAAIRAGAQARDAVKEAYQSLRQPADGQASFNAGFVEALRTSFTSMLRRAVGTSEVLALPVRQAITLSQRLYAEAGGVGGEVQYAVQRHANGVREVRKLALQLYDGYTPAEPWKRPLEGRARAELPAALRELTADPEARASVAELMQQAQARASRLKTQALRAAYEEAIAAWEENQAPEILRRKLDVAVREKTRYMAQRIARTELARAHQDERAAEVMRGRATVAQVMINPKHPRTDICDLHARADLWGLGAGCYPKADCPLPPFHPHCFCVVRSRAGLSAALARAVEGGEAAYLRDMPPEQAARVMGSAAKAEAVLNGASVESVFNDGKLPEYHARRLADFSPKLPSQHPNTPENDFPIKESQGNKERRIDNGFTNLIRIDPVKFAIAFNKGKGEVLEWDKSKTKNLSEIVKANPVDQYPRILGDADVLDGRHRLTLAAMMGKAIVVSIEDSGVRRAMRADWFIGEVGNE